MRKHIFFFFFLAALLLSGKAQSQCDNLALDFDGDADAVTLNFGTSFGNTDFTVEAWFQTTYAGAAGCPAGTFRRLFLLNGVAAGNNTSIELGVCDGGILQARWDNGLALGTGTVPGAVVNDGAWHHVALVRSGSTLRIVLDCTGIFSGTISGVFAVDHLGWGEGGTGEGWLGQSDELRFWNTARTAAQLCELKDCVLSGTLPASLKAYWTLEADGAVAAANNTAITQTLDQTANANNGSLTTGAGNFLLNGAASNYVCAPLPSAFDLEIRDVNKTGLLASLCSGDPAHFCLYDDTGNQVPSSAGMVTWQSNDGTGWTNLAYAGSCFVVQPGQITLDCDLSTQGFVDRQYRAVIVKSTAGLNCEFFSDPFPLRVCCPVANAGTDVTDILINITPSTALNGTLCEGDVVTLDVSLQSTHPFLPPAGLGNQAAINWSSNYATVSMYDDSGGFTLAVTAGEDDICFTAVIENCACGLLTVTKCVPVDPKPNCDSILGISPTLTLLSPSPMLVYDICPGDDAQLAFFDPAGFSDCIPVWEYSFDVIAGPWVPLGTSNSTQNTNLLPSYYWPAGASQIYYRVRCAPESTPSGCEPCYSNIIRVILKSPPALQSVVGSSPICKGGTATLSVPLVMTGTTYTWFHDGLEVGTGPTYAASEPGCYWFDSDDGCQVTTSPPFCLEVCEVIAVISCPLAPNKCVCTGDDVYVHLSGCDSADNCAGTLTYDWSIDGQHYASTCSMQYTPAINGNMVQLTVTNKITGCTDTASTFIKPCKN
jgi:hypothetical protein